jgi:hypothetical protein
MTELLADPLGDRPRVVRRRPAERSALLRSGVTFVLAVTLAVTVAATLAAGLGDAWMEAVLAEGATLPTHGDSPATTIDGALFARVVVEDGTYQAWALDTDQMRVTVAGRREHLESVRLRWWHPTRTP